MDDRLVDGVCFFCCGCCRWSLSDIRGRSSCLCWTRPSSWHQTTLTWASWSRSSGKHTRTYTHVLKHMLVGTLHQHTVHRRVCLVRGVYLEPYVCFTYQQKVKLKSVCVCDLPETAADKFVYRSCCSITKKGFKTGTHCTFSYRIIGSKLGITVPLGRDVTIHLWWSIGLLIIIKHKCWWGTSPGDINHQ